MRSHAESLERLKVARIDILLCHDIGRMTHGDAHAARVAEFLEGGYRAMRELRDAGTVRAIGLGVNEWEICVELLADCELDCILLAGRYTLLEQPALETLLPLCEQRRVSIICGGPFNSGILAAGSRAGAKTHYNYAAPPPAVLERVTRLEQLCARVFRAAAGRGAAVPAGASADRQRGGRMRQWRRSAQLRRHVFASDTVRVLARAARARAGRRARAAARMNDSMSTRVDSHQHFWRLDRGDYGWLTPALAPIYRDFLPEHLEPQLARAGVGATILVQAAATVAETRFMLELARDHSFIAGVVGWVDFESDDVVETIAALAADPAAGRSSAHDPGHPGSRVDAGRKTGAGLRGHDRPRPRVRCVGAAQTSCRRCSSSPRVIRIWPWCWITAPSRRSPPAISNAWKQGITELARSSPMVCKLSGLVTEAGSADAAAARGLGRSPARAPSARRA